MIKYVIKYRIKTVPKLRPKHKDIERFAFMCRVLSADQWEALCGFKPSSHRISEYRKAIDEEMKRLKDARSNIKK